VVVPAQLEDTQANEENVLAHTCGLRKVRTLALDVSPSTESNTVHIASTSEDVNPGEGRPALFLCLVRKHVEAVFKCPADALPHSGARLWNEAGCTPLAVCNSGV